MNNCNYEAPVVEVIELSFDNVTLCASGSNFHGGDSSEMEEEG